MDTLSGPGVTALGALGIVAGIVLLVRGLGGYRSLIRVSDTSTSTITSMAAGEVRVSGVIEPAEMTLISLLQSVACVYYRSTVGEVGERSPADRGYNEERSIGFLVRDATGSLRVFPRGARFDAPVRFKDETGTLGDEPAGLDIRRGGPTRAGRGRPRRRCCRSAARPEAGGVVAAGRHRRRRQAVVPRDAAGAWRRRDDRRARGSLSPNCPTRPGPTSATDRRTASTTRRSPPTWRRRERRVRSPTTRRARGGTPPSPGSASDDLSPNPTIDPAANQLPLAGPDEAARTTRTFEIAPETLVLAASDEVPLLIAYGEPGAVVDRGPDAPARRAARGACWRSPRRWSSAISVDGRIGP